MSVQSDRAFEWAIKEGYLSTDKRSPYYAGKFMFMTDRGTNLEFKHVDTRRYLSFAKK